MNIGEYQAFWKVIRALDENDLLKHVELVGSWCEYLYAQSGYLKGYNANLRTLDIDFLVKNMRKPAQKVSIATFAKENDFLIQHDVLTGTTKLFTTDSLEIEFIIEQKGAAKEPVIETNLGVNAQALQHLGMLKRFSMELNVLDFIINVPIPEAYVIHKMVINHERGNKSEKDKRSIDMLIPFLNQKKFDEVRCSLSKKESRRLEEYLNKDR